MLRPVAYRHTRRSCALRCRICISLENVAHQLFRLYLTRRAHYSWKDTRVHTRPRSPNIIVVAIINNDNNSDNNNNNNNNNSSSSSSSIIGIKIGQVRQFEALRRRGSSREPRGGGRDPQHLYIRDFKDTAYPFFESDTLFLECLFVLFVLVWRFFESRDVSTVPSKSIFGIPLVCGYRCYMRA